MAPGAPSDPQGRIRVGISSCLLGENVRFDGGHKREPYLVETLGRWFEWVPVCPEMEIGLGAPRESLRLIGKPGDPRLVAPASGSDHTDAMKAYARSRLRQLAGAGLHGYVLKKDSPTCGLFRVRVYPGGKGTSPTRDGAGLFAKALVEALPELPVEEEGRLNDMPLRENFIERVFAHRRWTEFLAKRPRAKDLVAFHAAEKMTLLAHSPEGQRELGRIVAKAGGADFGRTLEAYGLAFLEVLRQRSTARKHANVLQHLLGFLKETVDPDSRRELAERIEEYRKGLVPLVVPLTLLNHHFRRNPVEWVAGQSYLRPYPAELMLRNHV
jgi:uncharacterized protein YbgA (DUF1722 family)/uncharacterized protein YbbK (DUF523 family)